MNQNTIFLTLFYLLINNVNNQKLPFSNSSSSISPNYTSSIPLNSTSSSPINQSFLSNKTTIPPIQTIPYCQPLNISVPNNGTRGCAYSLNIPPDTHKYIAGFVIFAFFVGQTIHYFYLEEKNGIELRRSTENDGIPSNQLFEDEHREEEKIEENGLLMYLVAESKTPGGRVTTVLEKRKRAVAPPITPAYGAASINGIYESRTKTVQKEEAMICKMQITVDKWGRGTELISLINDTDIPPSLVNPDEKARFAMELVQQHVEKMTEQKVFLHGLLEDKTRILCGSENMDTEVFSEVRFELKLEMTSPVQLSISVFSVKMEPQIEQQKTIPPGRASELISIPNKETPKAEVPPTPGSYLDKKGKSTVTNSLEEKPKSSRPGKVTIQSPDRRERRDSSKRKTGKKTSDLSELVPLLQQVQANQTTEKAAKEKQKTPKESVPNTPEKPASGQMPPMAKKKKRESSSGQGSTLQPS
uniref:Uncharacterized protein n=1 Tax=Caenorhabditis tropicalis TaxID=1561998 RepID=A0A1I7TM60_9PELO